MSTVRRGASQYISVSAAISHNIPLPTGSVAGDWAILGASTQAFSAVFTLPGTQMLNAGDNTLHYGLSSKQLTGTDITNGYLTVGVSSSQAVAAVIVGYSTAQGFELPGAIWSKVTVSLNYTDAPAVTSDGTQDILVFSIIKHSGNPQSFTSDSPTTTSLASIWKDGSGQPGIHVGVYTGTAADRRSTWGVASTNGVGFQVAVTSTAAIDPNAHTAFQWDSGTLSAAGATVTGTVNESTPGSYPIATFPQDSAADYFSRQGLDLATYTARFYIDLPTAWAATSMPIFTGNRSGNVNQRLTLTGSGDPGRIRLIAPSNVQVAASPGGTIIPSTTYRLEIQANTGTSVFRAAIFNLGSDAALWDSGEQSITIGSAVQILSFGKTGILATLPNFSISRVKVLDTYGSWVGRHSSDPASSFEVLGVWGSGVTPTEILGTWNGTSVVPVEVIKVTGV